MTEPYALITGSSDRIGKAIALELAKQGYNLILHYNSSSEKAKAVKTEIEGLGVSAELAQIDFLADTDFEAFFQKLKAKGIRVEVLVNCASDFIPSGFSDKGKGLLEKELKINFENAYLLTKAFAEIYDEGLIVNFLDTKITKNHTKHLDYLLSKKLLTEFTKLSAVHLAPKFRVNAIAPGLVLPPPGKNEDYLLDLANEIPLKTIGGLDDILKAFRFLLESQFVTGQILYIDGGDHLI